MPWRRSTVRTAIAIALSLLPPPSTHANLIELRCSIHLLLIMPCFNQPRVFSLPEPIRCEMTENAIKPEIGCPQVGRERRFGTALPILLLVYLTTWALTGAHFMADTNVYTQAILRHQYGGGPVDYHLTTSNPFWDFGHLLWRPLGWLCFSLNSRTHWFANQNQRAEVILTLVGINFLTALACVILFFLLAKKIIGTPWPAMLATLGFFSADAFLNYTHSGSAYVVGLAALVAGMYFSFFENLQDASLGRATVAALMLALAVLFWFPYIFVLPAAIVAPLLFYGRDKQRLRFAGRTLVVCAVIGTAAYATGIAIVGIRNAADLRAWILAPGHGQIQPTGLRAAARLAFAVPRSFVNMDSDGMWLKRYLLHDPYAPVSLARLFRLSLWKLVLFYATASAIGIELLRRIQGRLILLTLAAAVLPIFFFAMFIFEAGSLERYLPLYPFVFLAFGYVLGDPRSHRTTRILLFVALAVTTKVNIEAMRRDRLDSRRAQVEQRIATLVPRLKPNDTVMAVNEQDNLAEFRQNFPLAPINLEREWQTYDVLEINTARLDTWRKDFAARVVTSWQRGGVVWIPQRFLHDEPSPEWNWVEGDDTRVKWKDLPSFFSQFDLGPPNDGQDGFVPLLDIPANRAILDSLSHGTPTTGLVVLAYSRDQA